MHRILLLDADHPLRAKLTEAIERTANTEVVIVADEEEMLSKLKGGTWAAVFADEALLPEGASRVIDAVRSALVRPMLVIASNQKTEELDPDLVTLVVRKPYDVYTLTGILLAAVMPFVGGDAKEPPAQVC